MDIIERIERTLSRMKDEGRQDTDGYKSLEFKLEAIKSEHQYRITSVSEKLIRQFGGLIATAQIMETIQNASDVKHKCRAFERLRKSFDEIRSMS